jgi:hypothetical protein
MGAHVVLASAALGPMANDLCRLGTSSRQSRRCRQTIYTNVALGLGWTTRRLRRDGPPLELLTDEPSISLRQLVSKLFGNDRHHFSSSPTCF